MIGAAGSRRNEQAQHWLEDAHVEEVTDSQFQEEGNAAPVTISLPASGEIGMEDISYFSTLPVSLEEIARLAEDAGYTCHRYDIRPDGEKSLEIDFGGLIERGFGATAFLDKDRWLLSNINLNDWGESEDRNKILALIPVAAIAIFYHVLHYPTLLDPPSKRANCIQIGSPSLRQNSIQHRPM